MSNAMRVNRKTFVTKRDAVSAIYKVVVPFEGYDNGEDVDPPSLQESLEVVEGLLQLLPRVHLEEELCVAVGRFSEVCPAGRRAGECQDCFANNNKGYTEVFCCLCDLRRAEDLRKHITPDLMEELGVDSWETAVHKNLKTLLEVYRHKLVKAIKKMGG